MSNKIELITKVTTKRVERTLKLYDAEYKETWTNVEGEYICKNQIWKQLDDKGYSDKMISLYEELIEENDLDRVSEIFDYMEDELIGDC